jgi:hypothetical protein
MTGPLTQVGAATAELLDEAGFSVAELGDLREAGVIE